MRNTGFYIDAGNLENCAKGYERTENGMENCKDTNIYMNLSGAHVAGGMYSTVNDLYLWDRAL